MLKDIEMEGQNLAGKGNSVRGKVGEVALFVY